MIIWSSDRSKRLLEEQRKKFVDENIKTRITKNKYGVYTLWVDLKKSQYEDITKIKKWWIK